MKRREKESLDRTLPAGFPERLTSDLVWKGDSVAQQYDWAYELSDADIRELDNALHYFKCERDD